MTTRPTPMPSGQLLGAGRASAAHMMKGKADRAERRAKGLRIIADLLEQHLVQDSEEEALAWEAVTFMRD